MSTGVQWSGTGAPRNGNEKRQLHGLGDELDAFSEEKLRQQPEVRIINKYAVVMAYIRMGVKGMSALALLWATVVLLGGFVSDLRRKDFWYLTIIAFVQAAGLSDAMGDARLVFFGDWFASLIINIISWGGKHHDERTQLPMRQWLKRQLNILRLKVIDITLALIFFPVVCFTAYGPSLCVVLSLLRLAKQDYGIADGDASKANMKPALTLFYCLSVVQSLVCLLSISAGGTAEMVFLDILSQQHGFSEKILSGYLEKTKQMCVNSPASTMSWNLITYGADLLDSQLPEDYVSGGRVLTMLIDQDTPLAITWLLSRSPRERIQKLIATLAWRSPAKQEMRCLAARIVEHLAGDLNLAHFPGALECIASLFDTSRHNNVDQEALHLTFVIDQGKQREKTLTQKFPGNPRKDKDGNMNFAGDKTIIRASLEAIYKTFVDMLNDDALQQDINKSGNCEDLVLTGLRILENLAHDRYNCTLIYNTEELLSKILAPVSSNTLGEDIKSNTEWTKLVDGSLKVVRRLMDSSGSTGTKMRSLIANNINGVKNLEAILEMDTGINSSVIDLQMRVIEVLTQLALHHPASTFDTNRREKLIQRMLHIFITTKWMEDYLKDEKRKIDKPTTSQQNNLDNIGTNRRDGKRKIDKPTTSKKKMAEQAAEALVAKKMKKAQETASRLKEKAGEALAMLSCDSEGIKSCKDDDVRLLTELLDTKIKTIDCKISATDTVQIEINIGCRISAAVILKHLSNSVKEQTLRKVLAELLPIQVEASSTSAPRCSECVIACITVIKNDAEMKSMHDELSASQSHLIQQSGERRLQAELLSLLTTIRANSNLDFAAILMSQTPPAALEDFVVRLKKIVEDNMYATPACLAIQKLSCEMVIEFIQQDQNVEVIDRHSIVGTLLEASETMAGLESVMLFSGVNRDCHGIPLKPLSSVLAKRAEDLLAQRKQALGINIPPAGVPPP